MDIDYMNYYFSGYFTNNINDLRYLEIFDIFEKKSFDKDIFLKNNHLKWEVMEALIDSAKFSNWIKTKSISNYYIKKWYFEFILNIDADPKIKGWNSNIYGSDFSNLFKRDKFYTKNKSDFLQVNGNPFYHTNKDKLAFYNIICIGADLYDLKFNFIKKRHTTKNIDILFKILKKINQNTIMGYIDKDGNEKILSRKNIFKFIDLESKKDFFNPIRQNYISFGKYNFDLIKNIKNNIFDKYLYYQSFQSDITIETYFEYLLDKKNYKNVIEYRWPPFYIDREKIIYKDQKISLDKDLDFIFFNGFIEKKNSKVIIIDNWCNFVVTNNLDNFNSGDHVYGIFQINYLKKLDKNVIFELFGKVVKIKKKMNLDFSYELLIEHNHIKNLCFNIPLNVDINDCEIISNFFQEKKYGKDSQKFLRNDKYFKIFTSTQKTLLFNKNLYIYFYIQILNKLQFKKIKRRYYNLNLFFFESYSSWAKTQTVDKKLLKNNNLKEFLELVIVYINRSVIYLNPEYSSIYQFIGSVLNSTNLFLKSTSVNEKSKLLKDFYQNFVNLILDIEKDETKIEFNNPNINKLKLDFLISMIQMYISYPNPETLVNIINIINKSFEKDKLLITKN